MAIRKYTNPREIDVSQGLQDVLRKNGMQAHITMSSDHGWQLIVLGHDSPVLNYKLTDQQVETLMNWGSTYANKKAYNTFTNIVKDDFYMPQNYVSASNAFGRVAMGLHGYRIGHGEYGYDARPARMPWFAPFSRHGRGWAGDFVGYAPRTEGFHLRRIGGHAYTPWGGGPMVTERPDGRVKPGECLSGGYGFYYRGHRQDTPVEVLDHLTIEPKLKPLEAAPRPQGQGIPYSAVITSDVYFSKDQFMEVLKSHGIVIDEQKKTLTIQSNLSKVDLQYDLTAEELQKLTANRVSGKGGVSVDDRLAIINSVIGKDFVTPVTKDMLETKELVSLDLKPDVRAEVEAPFIEQERRMAEQARLAAARQEQQREAQRIERDPNAINGREIQTIMGNKGWFQPVANGREMYVGEIRVQKALNADAYIMSAEINGRIVAHTISEKDYQKFLDLDDKHRLKMFDDIFQEVEIKSAHGQSLYQDDMYLAQDGQTVVQQREVDIAHATSNRVDGAALAEYNERQGFYRERAHGREVEVRDISVEPTTAGKYKMTAVINGQAISHEITQKQYDKFLAVDDYHRMQLFAKIFNEVDIKTRPGEGHNLGAALLAALVVTGEVVADGMAMRHEPRPEIYESHIGPTYHKPGVVSPADVAAANYRSEEATLGIPGTEETIHRGL